MQWGCGDAGGGGGKGGKGGSQPQPTGEQYQGTVKSVSEKFGFIQSPELQAAYGCDCFCLGNQLVQYGVGDVVQFTVGLNREGKPQALEITPLSTPSGGGGGGWTSNSCKAYGKGSKGGWSDSYKGGWMDSYKGGWDSKGYGGKGWDNDWGGPKGYGGWDAGKGWGGGKGWDIPKGGWSKGPPANSMDTGNIPMPTPTGEMYTGTIKSISPKFGFIECAEIAAKYGGDCFCLGRQLGSFQIGDQVEFQVGLNEQGKPQALSVSCNGIVNVWNDGKGTACASGGKPTGMTGGAPMGKDSGKGKYGGGGSWGGGYDGRGAAKGASYAKGKTDYSSPGGVKRKPEGTGETYLGVVKSCSAKFGFIQCEEVLQTYGADCFCLGEQLTGFTVGEQVYFEVGVNTKGQPQALTVSPATDVDGGEPADKAMRMTA